MIQCSTRCWRTWAGPGRWRCGAVRGRCCRGCCAAGRQLLEPAGPFAASLSRGEARNGPSGRLPGPCHKRTSGPLPDQRPCQRLARSRPPARPLAGQLPATVGSSPVCRTTNSKKSPCGGWRATAWRRSLRSSAVLRAQSIGGALGKRVGIQHDDSHDIPSCSLQCPRTRRRGHVSIQRGTHSLPTLRYFLFTAAQATRCAISS
jgi:hypothetical protein